MPSQRPDPYLNIVIFFIPAQQFIIKYSSSGLEPSTFPSPRNKSAITYKCGYPRHEGQSSEFRYWHTRSQLCLQRQVYYAHQTLKSNLQIEQDVLEGTYYACFHSNLNRKDHPIFKNLYKSVTLVSTKSVVVITSNADRSGRAVYGIGFDRSSTRIVGSNPTRGVQGVLWNV